MRRAFVFASRMGKPPLLMMIMMMMMWTAMAAVAAIMLLLWLEGWTDTVDNPVARVGPRWRRVVTVVVFWNESWVPENEKKAPTGQKWRLEGGRQRCRNYEALFRREN